MCEGPQQGEILMFRHVSIGTQDFNFVVSSTSIASGQRT
jgi:hypothetical protein